MPTSGHFNFAVGLPIKILVAFGAAVASLSVVNAKWRGKTPLGKYAELLLIR